MLDSRCLACGLKDHRAGNAVCKKRLAPDSCPLTCQSCSATLHVTPLGTVVRGGSAPRQGAASASSSSEPSRGATTQVQARAPPAKKARPEIAHPPPAVLPVRRPEAAHPPPAAPPVRRSFAQVSVSGEKYTTLEWFLGRGAKPNERKQALAHCKQRAVKLLGGNHTTLENAGVARTPPQHCKDLFPHRSTIPHTFQDTSVRVGRHPSRYVQAKLLPNTATLKNILLRVCDLRLCQHQFSW